MRAPVSTDAEPRGDLCIRTLTMPADTNANAIFLAAGSQ
jgi:acyl-CoA thioesterase YciA